jgi:hypothetical protein
LRDVQSCSGAAEVQLLGDGSLMQRSPTLSLSISGSAIPTRSAVGRVASGTVGRAQTRTVPPSMSWTVPVAHDWVMQ